MAQGKTTDQTRLYRDRRSFAKIPDVMDVPNLIAIQTDSFEFFKGEGLAQAFQDISPIENNTKDMCVEFGKHEFGEPKYTVDECKEKDVSYQAPLFVEIRFINRETGEIKMCIRDRLGVQRGPACGRARRVRTGAPDGADRAHAASARFPAARPSRAGDVYKRQQSTFLRPCASRSRRRWPTTISRNSIRCRSHRARTRT